MVDKQLTEKTSWEGLHGQNEDQTEELCSVPLAVSRTGEMEFRAS